MGFNSHPPLTDFPLPSLILLLVFEILALKNDWARKASFVALGMMALSVGAAFASGYHGQEFLIGQNTELDEQVAFHHACGRALLFATIALVGLKVGWSLARFQRTTFAILYTVALIGCIVLTAVTGYLGGELVFRLGAGVQSTSGVAE